MGKVSYKELNLKNQEIYIAMERYIRCSDILDSQKEKCISKISELVFKINKQYKYVENVIGDPKIYCDEIISPYKENTSKFNVFSEYIKKFSLLLSVFTLIISIIAPYSKVTLYDISTIALVIICSVSIDYINKVECEKMLFSTLKLEKIRFENIKYKFLSTFIVIVLFIFVFSTKNLLIDIKTIIPYWSLCILSIGTYLLSRVHISKLNKNINF